MESWIATVSMMFMVVYLAALSIRIGKIAEAAERIATALEKLKENKA